MTAAWGRAFTKFKRNLWCIAVAYPLLAVDWCLHRALPGRWFKFGRGRHMVCRATEWAWEQLDG